MNRAVLDKGAQSAFLEAAYEALGLTWDEIAALCSVSRKTVLDWRQEVSLIRHDALLWLAELSNLPVPHIHEIILERTTFINLNGGANCAGSTKRTDGTSLG
jgi:transcriptional regulator with XRE-family HTH domain